MGNRIGRPARVDLVALHSRDTQRLTDRITRLEEEVRSLKERVRVLEEIVCSCNRCGTKAGLYNFAEQTGREDLLCKFSAVQRLYWEDQFIDNFAPTDASSLQLFPLLPPETLRRYWTQSTAILSLTMQFLEKSGPLAQVVNLGAGYDTLYWRLKKENCKFSKFIDIDFESVAKEKLDWIHERKGLVELESVFTDQEFEYEIDLAAGDYFLIGTDLRQLGDFETKLNWANMDYMQPTLFIAENVLVYMDATQSNALLANISSLFPTASFIVCDEVNMADTYGDAKADELYGRGVMLPGLQACISIQTQIDRFETSGWPIVRAWTMRQIYKDVLNQHEVDRIEQLENLEQDELLIGLLEHRCLVYASNDSTEERRDLANLCPM